MLIYSNIYPVEGEVSDPLYIIIKEMNLNHGDLFIKSQTEALALNDTLSMEVGGNPYYVADENWNGTGESFKVVAGGSFTGFAVKVTVPC